MAETRLEDALSSRRPRRTRSLFRFDSAIYVVDLENSSKHRSTRGSAELSALSTSEQRFIALSLALSSKLIRESFFLVDAKFAKRKRNNPSSRRRPWKVNFSRYFYIFITVGNYSYFETTRTTTIIITGINPTSASLLLPDTRTTLQSRWFLKEERRRERTREKNERDGE